MKDYTVLFDKPYTIGYETLVKVEEELDASIDESDPKRWLVSLNREGAVLDHEKMKHALVQAGAKDIPPFAVKPNSQ